MGEQWRRLVSAARSFPFSCRSLLFSPRATRPQDLHSALWQEKLAEPKTPGYALTVFIQLYFVSSPELLHMRFAMESQI